MASFDNFSLFEIIKARYKGNVMKHCAPWDTKIGVQIIL
jgi:hypothetical protein